MGPSVVKNLDFSNLLSTFTLNSSLLLVVRVMVLSSHPDISLVPDVVREIEVPPPEILRPQMLVTVDPEIFKLEMFGRELLELEMPEILVRDELVLEMLVRDALVPETLHRPATLFVSTSLKGTVMPEMLVGVALAMIDFPPPIVGLTGKLPELCS